MPEPYTPEQRPQPTTDEYATKEHEQTVPEIVEANLTGTDEPMEKQHPTAPGALVWFTFPALLIVVLLVALVVIAFMQRS